GLEAPRPRMVDGASWNGERRRGGQYGEDGHEVERRFLRDGDPDDPGDKGDENITRLVEGGVSSKPRRERLVAEEAKGDGGDRRREQTPKDRHDDVGDEHDRKDRPGRDRQSAG